MTVEGAGRAWYGILEINPRYMEKQSWQEMRDELVEEIKTLSFDFMKRNIHISRQLEGRLASIRKCCSASTPSATNRPWC